MNLARILAERAAEHPGGPCLLFEGDVLSYGDLDRRTAVAAASLRAAGVGVGDRVAIRLPNAPAYVAAYFGALRAGAIAVPLNVLLAPPEVEARITASSPVTIVDSALLRCSSAGRRSSVRRGRIPRRRRPRPTARAGSLRAISGTSTRTVT